MKVTVNENREIIIKELYLAIGLESDSGDQLSICMRDGGFEFAYGNKMYEAKEGELKVIRCIEPCGMNYCDENGCTERKRYSVNDYDLAPPQTNSQLNSTEEMSCLPPTFINGVRQTKQSKG
jgi:hypothetical protein